MSNTATFVTKDNVTLGTWKSPASYGTDGYIIVGNTTSLPGYASVVVSGGGDNTWAGSITDGRSCQKAATPTDRLAAIRASNSTIDVTITISDSNTHQVSFYLLDYDNQSRSTRIDVRDADTNALLDSQTISAYVDGVWAVWNISGHIKFTTVTLTGPNSGYSAICFDPVSTSPYARTNAVLYIGTDTVNQGTWKSPTQIYGLEGYEIINYSTSLPATVILTPFYGFSDSTWVASSTDVRALQKPDNPTSRIAAVRSNPTSYELAFKFTNSASHKLTLYNLDWDSAGRSSKFEWFDADSGSLLDTRTISTYTNGIYITWTIRGNLKLKITKLAGTNVGYSGLFFDPAVAAPRTPGSGLGTRAGTRLIRYNGIMSLLKQSTAYTREFLMVDSSDHITGKTGLSPTVTLSKAGGAFAAAAGTVTEVGNGIYKIAYTTADTNTLGDLSVHCEGTGADPTDFIDQVIVFDLASANVTVGTNNDKTDYLLSTTGNSAVAQAAWDYQTSLVTTPSTMGIQLKTNCDAQSSLIKAKTDNLPNGILKNSPFANFEFAMVSAVDHSTPVTGLTITAKRSIDGGIFASCTNAAVELSDGIYKIDLSASDLNGDFITFMFSAALADTCIIGLKTTS